MSQRVFVHRWNGDADNVGELNRMLESGEQRICEVFPCQGNSPDSGRVNYILRDADDCGGDDGDGWKRGRCGGGD